MNNETKAVKLFIDNLPKKHRTPLLREKTIEFLKTSEELNSATYALILDECFQSTLIPYLNLAVWYYAQKEKNPPESVTSTLIYTSKRILSATPASAAESLEPYAQLLLKLTENFGASNPTESPQNDNS